MMNVLVTGGAGYIGSHVCKALAAHGHRPVVLDNLSKGHRWAVIWGNLVVGDCCDSVAVGNVFRDHRIEAVVHMAASSDVAESVAMPSTYMYNNVVGTLTVLREAVSHSCKGLVLSSTCTAKVPNNPYGRSKQLCELAMCGMPTAVLRYYNAAGASSDGDIGEAHSPETHLVPNAMLAALGRRDEFQIFGTDWPTRDGTAERDYVHVSDLAEAHVTAVEQLLAGRDSYCRDLGTGRGHTVKEVISAVENESGRKVPLVYRPRRAGDVASLVADYPTCSRGLEEIVRDAWRWHSRR